jgi:hypothetical protein
MPDTINEEKKQGFSIELLIYFLSHAIDSEGSI